MLKQSHLSKAWASSYHVHRDGIFPNIFGALLLSTLTPQQKLPNL